MNPLRIFYDHQVTSLQDAGGISRYYFELIQALLRAGGVEPQLILGWQNSVVPFDALPKPASVLAMRSQFKPGYARYALNEVLTASLAPFQEKYDVYHAGYQRLVPYVRRKAVVVTHHDSVVARFPKLFPDAATIQRRLDKIYAKADRILCISESSRQDLLHFHSVALEKTEVIHHGFTPLMIPEVSTTSPSPFDGRPYLLYVGARHSYKNFATVLQALSRLRDRSLCVRVVGGGPWTAQESLLIERLQLVNRVLLISRATDAELAAAYRSALVFIYPSLYEGFGFPPLEAMQAGCPAIVSRTSALPEICGDAAFYFDPTNVEELATLLESLSENESFRLSKRAAGFEQVGRYTWEKAATETLAAYRATLQSKHS